MTSPFVPGSPGEQLFKAAREAETLAHQKDKELKALQDSCTHQWSLFGGSDSELKHCTVCGKVAFYD